MVCNRILHCSCNVTADSQRDHAYFWRDEHWQNQSKLDILEHSCGTVFWLVYYVAKIGVAKKTDIRKHILIFLNFLNLFWCGFISNFFFRYFTCSDYMMNVLAFVLILKFVDWYSPLVHEHTKYLLVWSLQIHFLLTL